MWIKTESSAPNSKDELVRCQVFPKGAMGYALFTGGSGREYASNFLTTGCT